MAAGANFTTVGAVIEAGSPLPADGLWLATAFGPKRVAYFRGVDVGDPWIVTGRGLDQQSFCIHYGVPLYYSAADAQAAHEAEQARIAAFARR